VLVRIRKCIETNADPRNCSPLYFLINHTILLFTGWKGNNRSACRIIGSPSVDGRWCCWCLRKEKLLIRVIAKILWISLYICVKKRFTSPLFCFVFLLYFSISQSGWETQGINDDLWPKNPCHKDWPWSDAVSHPACVTSLSYLLPAPPACVPAASLPLTYFIKIVIDLLSAVKSWLFYTVLQTHLMVRMDWQPAPDGLAQILQLLKVSSSDTVKSGNFVIDGKVRQWPP